MFKVYILYSPSIDKFYIGHTNNMQARLEKHLQGTTRFTSQVKDWQLVYSEDYKTKSEAMKRENYIKKMKSRKFIIELINSKL